MTTSIKTTGEVLARALVDSEIDTVFGIPGAHIYDFNDALYGVRDKLRFVHTRHEQGSGYMAYGYSKSTGRVGVFSVVPGPGVLNAGAALCTAYGANAPVLCITGNIMSDLIGRGRGQLHELPDQLATLRGITKTAERVNHPSEAGPIFRTVLAKMLSGRQGPGAIEAPWDVFGMPGVVAPTETIEPTPTPLPDAGAIAEAARLINGARKPLIMVGGGSVDAPAEVRRFAEKIGAAVTSHRSGKGVLPDDHPQSLNFVAAYDYWKDVDLLIGIGSRLELQFMRWRYRPKHLKIIRIDADPTEMVRLKPDIGIVADARIALRALTEAVSPSADQDRVASFTDLNARARARFSSVQPQIDYLNVIRDVLPRDGFFVEEICQMGFAARFAFPVYEPRQYVTCGYQDNLGFGFNTALGVKVAHPDKPVVSISGDGGFLFGVQELATAVQHNINVVAVVFNNSGFGNVLRDQRDTYKGRLIGSELTNPDFVNLGRSFGVHSVRTDTPEGLRTALSEALAADTPALIEVTMPRGAEASPWQFIHPAPHVD